MCIGRFSAAARVRLGKMKPPVGLERLQSGAWLAFVERALPTALVPNRDLGAQLHGELAGGRVAYALGVFNGVVDGGSADTDTGDGKDVAPRLFVQPLRKAERSPLQGLGFGVAGTLGEQTGALPSYRSGGQLVFFSYAAAARADGQRSRLAPQVSLYSRRVGVLGEWALSPQSVASGATRTRVANAAGWVGSLPGRHGGYTLAKKSTELTMGRVVRHFDGVLAPIACVSLSHREVCSQESVCRFRRVLLDVRNQTAALMDRATLALVHAGRPVTEEELYSDRLMYGAGI